MTIKFTRPRPLLTTHFKTKTHGLKKTMAELKAHDPWFPSPQPDKNQKPNKTKTHGLITIQSPWPNPSPNDTILQYSTIIR